MTSCYLPPYGTVVRSSVIVVSARDDDRDGGNYWTNPASDLNRYPSRERSYNGFVRDEDTVTVSGGRTGMPRKVDADWWETRRVDADRYEDDNYIRNDEEFDEDEEYYDDYEEEEKYGLPPPGRSRSVFCLWM